MNIEKEIYTLLMKNAGFKQEAINEVSQPTLRMLKKGSGKTSIYKVFDALFLNGISSVTLQSESGELTLNAESRQIFAKPTRTYNKK